MLIATASPFAAPPTDAMILPVPDSVELTRPAWSMALVPEYWKPSIQVPVQPLPSNCQMSPVKFVPSVVVTPI